MVSITPVQQESHQINKWLSEFVSPKLEQEYQHSNLEKHKIFFQFFSLMFAFILLLVMLLEYSLLYEGKTKSFLLTTRAMLIIGFLMFVLFTPLIKTNKQFNTVFILTNLMYLYALQLIEYKTSSFFTIFILYDVLLLTFLYSCLLLSFKWAVFLGMSYSIVTITVFILFKQQNFHSNAVTVMGIMAANITGMYICHYNHIRKRTLFLRNKELEKMALEIKKQAYTDPLTKLYNRRALDDLYKSLVADTGTDNPPIKNKSLNTFAILSDIDFFKQVNDTYGHDIGDEVLIIFAQRLTQSLRDTDHVFRLGGEEFLIIMRDCTKENAIKRIEAIIEQSNQEVLTVNNSCLKITCSFGLTAYQIGDDQDTLLARADKALYQAKKNGRNQIVVDDTLHH